MIGSLRGTIVETDLALDKGTGEVLLEAAGVGYNVTVTSATLSQCVVGDEKFLYIYHHIREADQKLFGFLAKSERQTFAGLLAAHGVGPAMALAVMSTHPVSQLARILENEDIAALCEVPGVGKKTAQRLLVELKSRLVLPTIDTGDGFENKTVAPTSAADVREALANLGYSSEEIAQAVKDLDYSDDSGAMLKAALRSLASEG